MATVGPKFVRASAPLLDIMLIVHGVNRGQTEVRVGQDDGRIGEAGLSVDDLWRAAALEFAEAQETLGLSED